MTVPMKSKDNSKNKKGFQSKQGSPVETETAAPAAVSKTAAPAKPEAPKGPVEITSKNDTLKCVTATHKGLTYFGIKNAKGEVFWRNCFNVKRIFDKADVINADEKLDAKAKEVKIAEALKSMTNPVVNLPFTAKSEGEKAFDAPVAEAPAA